MRAGIEWAYVSDDVRPQDDLFRYVNGAWLDEVEIPADRAVDGAFRTLYDRAEIDLRTLIEEAVAAAEAGTANPEQRKIGDLFACFMDEQTAQVLGADPIRATLEAIDAVEDGAGLLRLLGGLQRDGLASAFATFVDTDPLQSDRYIVNFYQGGLGLPDRSYYTDDQFAEIRETYAQHIARMFELAGVPEPGPKVARVVRLETTLAAAHWDRVESRDESKTNNKLTWAQVEDLTPGVAWAAWREGLGAPAGVFDHAVIRQPSFFTALAAALDELPLTDWQAWLTWNVLREAAPYLSDGFVQERFAFYGTTLSGTKQISEPWKRGVSLVEGALGEALGSLYVARHFPPAAKDKMLDLVANLVEAYRVNILAVEWMGEETKARALDKLDKFTPKIGYPDNWRDYSALTVTRDDLLGNVRRAASFDLDRNLGKIGQPVDRSEWFMTPQTVNAYYNPGMNEIVFPAAILQPPFFDLHADDAANYGGIGAVIGHEIGHGFDDQGSKYDGDGNLADWWTDHDRAEFDQRTTALIKQYDEFEPRGLSGHRVNGAFTVGENIGDLAGLAIACKAYGIALDGTEAPVLEGLTPQQRLFFGWAQVWRTKARDEEAIRRLATDPHSPAEFRCNGVLRNLDEFYEAFGVTEADALWLAPDERVRIW